MALATDTVWEVRTTGSDNNGGGFVTGSGGTDRSLQDLAHATLTVASVIGATTTHIDVAVGDYTVIAGDVGNLLQITGGTATAGFYQIVSVDIPNNRWVVDRAAGTTGQTVVGAMGGAAASPGKIALSVVAGHKVFIKSGTYDISVNTDNVSNGKWSRNAGILIIGYNTNRFWGNVDTRPTIRATVSLSPMWNGSNNWVNNIIFNANSQATTRCVSNGAYTRCSFNNATLANTGIGFASHCTATGNSGTPFVGSGSYIYCESHGNTAAGFNVSNSTLIGCLSYDNTGATSDGFIVANIASGHFFSCVAFNNGRDGFRTTSSGSSISRAILQNCIAENNAGFGMNSTTSMYPSLLIRCSFFNNTSGATTGTVDEIATLSPSASVFTNAATADFSLNNTAGAGASLRAVGYIDLGSNTFPRGLTTSNLDVGAAQHLDGGGGGGSSEHSAVF